MFGRSGYRLSWFLVPEPKGHRGFSAVAISTANGALRHFHRNALKAGGIRDENAHVLKFLTGNVIEIQNHDIGLTAIDAGVLRQIIRNEVTIAIEVALLASVLAKVKRL